MTLPTASAVDIKFLRGFLSAAFLDAFGLSEQSWARLPLRPIVWTPAHLFARMCAGFDKYVAEQGFVQAAGWLLTRFVSNIDITGQDHIPTEGPLILASNHPGNIDALAIAANLPRADLKILALDIPLVQGLPHASQHFIYSTADDASAQRMLAVRSAIRHLQAGGALLIFPAGHISPDPGVLSGAEQNLQTWSASLKLFLRKVPATKIQLAMLSHITLPGFFGHPITRSRQEKVPRQILAQHIQVASQLLRPRRWMLFPKLSFAAALTLPELQKDGDIHKAIVDQAQTLLREHVCKYEGLL